MGERRKLTTKALGREWSSSIPVLVSGHTMTAVANVLAGARERDGLPAGFKDDDWKIVGMPIGCRMTSSAW